MLPGQATSVVLDPDSGAVINSGTATTSRATSRSFTPASEGVGVEMSPNQGQIWSVMTGGDGNPLIVNDFNGTRHVNPTAGPTPNGAEGQIDLGVPGATGQRRRRSDLRRLALRGRRNTRRRLLRTLRHQRLRRELDRSPHPQPRAQDDPDQRRQPCPIIPSPATASSIAQGNYDLILTIDPTNPNIVYLGGSRRLDGNPVPTRPR